MATMSQRVSDLEAWKTAHLVNHVTTGHPGTATGVHGHPHPSTPADALTEAEVISLRALIAGGGGGTVPPTLTPPGPPLDLVAVVGDGEVDLTWAAPASNGGSAITGYRVYRSDILLATLGVVLAYNDPTAVNGTLYGYEVAAVTAVGEGPTGNVAPVMPGVPDTTPPVISGIAVGSITETSALISWTTDEPATSQIEYGPTTGYGSSTTLNGSFVALSHSESISGLTANTLYHYRVKSGDASSNLATSSDGTFTTEAVAPPAVTGYFVAPGGNDSNTGTSLGAAWATLQKAANAMPTGQTCWVRAGTYSAALNVSRTGLTFKRYPGDNRYVISLAAQFPVQISAAGTVFAGFEVTGANTQWGAGVRITASVNSANSVLIDDFVAHDCRSFAFYLQGARGVTIRNGEIYKCDSAVQISDGGGNIQIYNNTFRDLDTMVVLVNPALQQSWWEVPVGGLINDPTRYGTGDRGANAVVLTRTNGVVIHDNIAFGLRAKSNQYATDGGFIEFFECSDIDVYDNTVWDAENLAETGNGSGQPACDDLRVFRNLLYRGVVRNVAGSTNGLILRSAKNSLVAHNTFVDMLDVNPSKTFAIDIANSGSFAGGVDGLKVLNNICTGTTKQLSVDTAMPVSVQIDYNLYRNSTGGSICYYQPASANFTTIAALRAASPYEDHGVQADPLFTNPATSDYTLQAGSPAIDAGLIDAIVGESYLGAAPDIGAFEKA